MADLMRRHFLTTLSACFLLASTAHSQSLNRAQNQAQAIVMTAECEMEIDFRTETVAQQWRAVNDGVMGGLSSGGPNFDAGHMTFSGVINTNGGGFSSVRSSAKPGELTGTDGLSLRVKSDGRDYKVTMRTNATYGWRRISFQAPIKTQSAGEWETVNISYDDLRASIFGRPIRGASFDKSEVVEIGIILSDGRDGPFSLEVESIKAC